MKLLLLLSALLSALSGASVGARGLQTPVAVNRMANVAAVSQAVAVQRVSRPVAVLPSLSETASAPIALVLRLAAPAPLYLNRRRE